MSQPDSSPVAIVLRTITLHEGAVEDEFEQFMIESLFPTVQTGPEDKPDQHFLLRIGEPYTWMSHLSYEIHQTPLPVWLTDRIDEMYKSVQEKVERFGTQTSVEFFYDVAAWRHILGR
jgi:hypothetical protein